MTNIKISSKIDEVAWEDLKQLANESHQNISGVLTEAVKEYVNKRRVRPLLLSQLEQSMLVNEELGKLLGK